MAGTKTGLTDALAWALRYIEANPGCAPWQIGQAMTDRPGFGHGHKPGRLNKAQGYGRLGARMSSLLRQRGLVITYPAPIHGMQTLAKATAAGRLALADRARAALGDPTPTAVSTPQTSGESS
jgi:hypothetical protein